MTVTNSSECSDNPQAKRDWGAPSRDALWKALVSPKDVSSGNTCAPNHARRQGETEEKRGERGADHLDTALEMAVGAVGK